MVKPTGARLGWAHPSVEERVGRHRGELHTACCLTTKSRLNEARKRLGLESEARSEAIALQVWIKPMLETVVIITLLTEQKLRSVE